ncbi:glutathione S-transferase family protein [Nereida sp. MMG025]|uniref:glutathione S-transferase family protein n=1 Tax=Nereida sp. MMG025 TaxID=2909981 RepID=UPI001F37B37B|nr:glutathione S-transferase family protein [Nereida sp. MMG025]MCF6444775.1 glutathione S-transferase family protein [Nereida sp. MMG025]
MRETIKVVGTVTSRAFRVLWACEEMGVEYEWIAAAARSDEAKAINPTGKIPALLVNDTLLTDSVAIMTYLADKHADLTYPAGTLERAQQDAHMNFILDEMDAVLWMAAKHSFILPETLRVPEVKNSLRAEFATSIERLEQRIKGPFLMGERMTIADILAVHCLNWAISAKMAVENQTVDAYAKRLRARDAFKRVRALANT